jgi:hypothetical protein
MEELSMEVMTEKGTKRLVELLRADLVTAENKITEMVTTIEPLIGGNVQVVDYISDKTIMAWPTVAEYSREDIAGICYTADTGWQQCTVLTSRVSSVYWTDGCSPLNLKACGDLYFPTSMHASINGADYQMNPGWLKTADLVANADGTYTWKGWVDSYDTTGTYRIISTPNNLIELTITAVTAVEVK